MTGLREALAILEKDHSQILEGLVRLRETGSYYSDGTLLDSDARTAFDDLVVLCRFTGFDQSKWSGVLSNRLKRGSIERGLRGAMRRAGGGVHFQEVATLSVTLDGHIPSGVGQQLSAAAEFVLATDARPEWTLPLSNWSKKADILSTALLTHAYWSDDKEFAERVLVKGWLPGGASALSIGDLSRNWKKGSLEGLTLEYWRRHWRAVMGFEPFDESARRRTLAHALSVYEDAWLFSVGLHELFCMAHASMFGSSRRSFIRDVLEYLLGITPALWNAPISRRPM